ncbi:MAG: glutamine--fructose-6-phosphate transaminase (isomerizing) [Fidelibacterota bacterium]
MCGIVGYLGERDSIPILLQGLRRLEYRGYDSAGVATLDGETVNVVKKKGKVSTLCNLVEDSTLRGTIGIGHTRWATHGEPNDINAHPHVDDSGKIALVHNGIIENHDTLRQVLSSNGTSFRTETDSEVLVQLIGDIYKGGGISIEDAVQAALIEIVGAYGIVVVCADDPDTLILARMGSPLVLGVGDAEYFVASDATPIIEHTRNVIYLDDGDMAIVNRKGHKIKRIAENHIVTKRIERIEYSIEAIEKEGFPHYMLKEINDQAHTITDTLRGRLKKDGYRAHLGGLADFLTPIESAKMCYITACGTSWHAGLIGAYLLEEYAGMNVKVEYASEFRYRRATILPGTVVIAVSQSGETADTLASVRKARDAGALTVGICNVVGSTLARETDCGIYTHAGPEIGVASTKAFTAQIAVFMLMALQFGYKKRLSAIEAKGIGEALLNISKHVQSLLNRSNEMLEIAKKYATINNFLYLGRGLNFPAALEGALKLKEISYIHAEGYPAAEMKHGPIALIDEKMPVVFVAPHDQTYKKVLANMQEVKARRGRIIAVTDRADRELSELADHIIEVPRVHRVVFPILATIPLQLLAYHIAVIRGCDVDQPRNLAKSVTVE